MLAAFRLSPAYRNIAFVDTHVKALPAAAIFAVASFFTSYALGLGHYGNLRSRSRIALLVLLLSLFAMGAASLVLSSIFYKQIGRHIVAIGTALFFVTEAVVRIFWHSRVASVTHNIVICSDDAYARELRVLLESASFHVQVLSVLRCESIDASILHATLADQRLHEIVIHGLPAALKPQLLEAIDQEVAVSSMDAFAERHFLKIPCNFIDADWFFQIDFKQHHPFYYRTKRLLDILFSVTGGLLASPALLIACLAIKLESRGPIFYSQVRVGQLQKPFTIWKLRTMRVDSESSGPQWARTGDPRVTRVGILLRKTRIDEIPQFWNIFCGEMALIGPRPERPEFVAKLAQTIPFYRQRHLAKPGLTGWAQICYRYGASEADAREKLSYDLYYLKNASPLLDLQILLQTVSAVAKGAR